jgi:hypothetical protein
MIVGISGRMQSGKDTVGKIIQYLVDAKINFNLKDINEEDFNFYLDAQKNSFYPDIKISDWQIKRFADKVKDIVCLLTGCTKEQLEDNDFKNTKLPNEWIRYGYADEFHVDPLGSPIMNNRQCDKERYEEELKTNHQTAYKFHMTYRELLQYIGTDLFRKKFHTETWINALFSEYKKPAQNWIIPDCRFPNEFEAIKNRDGIVIRVNRFNPNEKLFGNHISEVALDCHQFDYVINNNSTIDELINQVKVILQKENLI